MFSGKGDFFKREICAMQFRRIKNGKGSPLAGSSKQMIWRSKSRIVANGHLGRFTLSI